MNSSWDIQRCSGKRSAAQAYGGLGPMADVHRYWSGAMRSSGDLRSTMLGQISQGWSDLAACGTDRAKSLVARAEGYAAREGIWRPGCSSGLHSKVRPSMTIFWPVSVISSAGDEGRRARGGAEAQPDADASFRVVGKEHPSVIHGPAAHGGADEYVL